MEYVVIAFRSRAHTVKFSNFLNSNGVGNQIVNTPKEAGVGCGLSVKISKEQFYAVKKIVMRLNINSFAGFFLVKSALGRKVVKSI